MNGQHLTDEQFSDLMAGEIAPSAAAMHVQACESCRSELSSLRSATVTLRSLSLDWAEKRATQILPPSRWMLSWRWLPGWGAAASLLLCGVVLGVHFQRIEQATAPEINQSQAVAATPSQDELSEDNQLLRSIDQELSRQVRPQVPASELTVSSTTRHRDVPPEVSN